jgi:hypothetical protein
VQITELLDTPEVVAAFLALELDQAEATEGESTGAKN